MERTITPEFLHLCMGLADIAEDNDTHGEYRFEVDTRKIFSWCITDCDSVARTMRLGALEYLQLWKNYYELKDSRNFWHKEWEYLRKYIEKFFGIDNAPEEYSFTDEEAERIREFIRAIVEEHNSGTTRKE